MIDGDFLFLVPFLVFPFCFFLMLETNTMERDHGICLMEMIGDNDDGDNDTRMDDDTQHIREGESSFAMV
jgi:hypothetical protein